MKCAFQFPDMDMDPNESPTGFYARCNLTREYTEGHDCGHDDKYLTRRGYVIAHRCSEVFTDRAEYEDHMTSAHRARAYRPAKPLKPEKPPRAPKTPKPYEPAPNTPGARITFTQLVSGRDDTARTTTVIRHGTVWSLAPGPRSLWVQPDGDTRHPIVVVLPPPRARHLRHLPMARDVLPHGWVDPATDESHD